MFSTTTYISRRNKLQQQLNGGLVLLLGNQEVGMNYTGNPYHFRQDSTFLYYIGIDRPNLMAIIDVDAGKTFLFGNEASLEDIVWIGKQPSLQSLAQKVGIETIIKPGDINFHITTAQQKGRTIHYLPPYRYQNRFQLHLLLGMPFTAIANHHSETLIKAVVAQRSIKSKEEIAALDQAVTVSGMMHQAVMKAAKVGMKEAELVGIAEGIATSMGGYPGYGTILTIHGEVLHNHHHHHTLNSGGLVLGDFGAAMANHYTGDITRTFPVDKQFSLQQKTIYQIVLDAQETVIQHCKAGVLYKDMHTLAAKTIVNGLKEIGLMKGDTEEAVSAGAHALFFPHGLGHQIGLDVHDMEDLGEDYVGYSDNVQRSKQFGTAYLRLGKELEAGMVITVEPGIYFIPTLIEQWAASGKHQDFINYNELKSYTDFGGIRIEDNIHITVTGNTVLGKPIPKSVEEVEALRG